MWYRLTNMYLNSKSATSTRLHLKYFTFEFVVRPDCLWKIHSVEVIAVIGKLLLSIRVFLCLYVRRV